MNNLYFQRCNNNDSIRFSMMSLTMKRVVPSNIYKTRKVTNNETGNSASLIKLKEKIL